MLDGGWGRLGAAGGKGGGQRRRRRRGDFGLNTGIFSPKLYFLVRHAGELQARCVSFRGGVKTTKISHQEKYGFMFSPTSTSVPPAPLRSGCAVDAQRMSSRCGD